MFVAVDGKPAGLLGVADPIKETTPEAIAPLHDEGIRIVMLTGDSRTTAEAVAGQAGHRRGEAEVLPEEKAEMVKRAAGRGPVSWPWPATASTTPRRWPQAQVGIAMGTGTDVAMESAGVTLVKGDLRRHRPGPAAEPRAPCATSARTCSSPSSTTRSASRSPPGVLYPFFGLLLSPMIAAAAMSFSSVSVISNALRLRTARIEAGVLMPDLGSRNSRLPHLRQRAGSARPIADTHKGRHPSWSTSFQGHNRDWQAACNHSVPKFTYFSYEEDPMKKLALILLAVGGAVVAAPNARTFTGVITDTMCGANHRMMHVTPYRSAFVSASRWIRPNTSTRCTTGNTSMF